MAAKSDKPISKRQVRQEDLESLLSEFLGMPIRVDGVEPGVEYERLHDDHDGENVGTIRVKLGNDNDVWFGSDQFVGPMLRFRTQDGGGRSPRVWNALRILALAIKLDEAEHPDRR